MPPEKRDPALLFDMLDSAQFIVSTVRGKSFDDYRQDRGIRSIVERQLEIVGEAARHISAAFKNVHSEIPWRKIINQRHVLAHDYGEIENEIIWEVATVHIIELIRQLKPLVPATPGDEFE
jgi:uncharacterized protein with HEPN domain